MAIKNIIFDLGGVLLDIDFIRTRDAFVASGINDFDKYFQQSYSHPLFAGLETGKVSPEIFFDDFRKESGLSIDDQTIRYNWNLLLGAFRRDSIKYLRELKSYYKLFLFSNTNQIHYEAFIALFKAEYGEDVFDDLFDKTYYSHNMSMRKPDHEGFVHIVTENNLLAEETLFVDDTYINIEAAEQVGLQTLWLEKGLLIENVLPGILELNP